MCVKLVVLFALLESRLFRIRSVGVSSPTFNSMICPNLWTNVYTMLIDTQQLMNIARPNAPEV